MREFYSVAGRRWTATLFYIPSDGAGLWGHDTILASTSVLRFQSDDVVMDLANWPDDWFRLPDAALMSLLLRAKIPSYPPLRSSYDDAARVFCAEHHA